MEAPGHEAFEEIALPFGRALVASARPAWLRDPAALEPARLLRDATRLKNSRKTSVYRIEAGGAPYIVKTYVPRYFLSGLLGPLYPRRALRVWRASRVLRGQGARSPRLWACVLAKRNSPRPLDFVIMDLCPGVGLNDFVRQETDLARRRGARERLEEFLRLLRKLRASHGDMKANNFYVDGDSLWVIDLDGFRFHKFAFSWRRHHQNDLRRLRQNRFAYDNTDDVFLIDDV